MGLVKPGQEFTPEHIEQIYHKGNNDGFGMAYVEGERFEEGPNKGKLIKPGRVKIVKSMGLSVEVKNLYKTQLEMGVPFVFHLRNATAGDKVVENCHPYKVLDMDDGDPIDLWMFHNGTMRNAWIEKAKSDSRNFAETHLRGLLRERPSMLYEEGFRFFLASMIESNKLIFIDNRERVSIINHDLGSYHPGSGVWLSTKDNITPYVPYKAPVQQVAAGFQLGAGRGNTNTTAPANHTSTEEESSKGKISWIQEDGSKWVLSADDRSHYLPKGVSFEDKQETPLLPEAAGKADDEEFIRLLIEKAAPPKTPADYYALKATLNRMTHMEVFSWVQGFPVEAAYMIRWGAGIYPDVLPEFTEMDIKEVVEYCVASAWNAAHGLGFLARQKVEVHEVN